MLKLYSFILTIICVFLIGASSEKEKSNIKANVKVKAKETQSLDCNKTGIYEATLSKKNILFCISIANEPITIRIPKNYEILSNIMHNAELIVQQKPDDARTIIVYKSEEAEGDKPTKLTMWLINKEDNNVSTIVIRIKFIDQDINATSAVVLQDNKSESKYEEDYSDYSENPSWLPGFVKHMAQSLPDTRIVCSRKIIRANQELVVFKRYEICRFGDILYVKFGIENLSRSTIHFGGVDVSLASDNEESSEKEDNTDNKKNANEVTIGNAEVRTKQTSGTRGTNTEINYKEELTGIVSFVLIEDIKDKPYLKLVWQESGGIGRVITIKGRKFE